MKTLTFLFSLLFLSTICFGQVNPNYHRVNGYYRNNGTYVQSHNRTNPNCTNRDNYSTYPNINPHTGKQGTVAPDNNFCISLPSSLPTIMHSGIENNVSEMSKEAERLRATQDKIFGMDEKALRENSTNIKKQEKEFNATLNKIQVELDKNAPFDLNKYMSDQTEKKLREEYGLKKQIQK